jgi:hypothetical protein
MLTRKPPPPQPDVPIDEKIESFRAELERYIESRLDDLQKEAPGVPRVVLRNLVENRARGCVCIQALELARS